MQGRAMHQRQLLERTHPKHVNSKKKHLINLSCSADNATEYSLSIMIKIVSAFISLVFMSINGYIENSTFKGTHVGAQ